MSISIVDKVKILGVVEEKTISPQQFEKFNEKIETIISAPIPQAKTVDLQSTLDTRYQAYLQFVREHQANLKIQFDLGQKMIQQIKKADQLSQIGSIVTAFQTAITPAMKSHLTLQWEITSLENQITPMLPSTIIFLS